MIYFREHKLSHELSYIYIYKIKIYINIILNINALIDYDIVQCFAVGFHSYRYKKISIKN